MFCFFWGGERERDGGAIHNSRIEPSAVTNLSAATLPCKDGKAVPVPCVPVAIAPPIVLDDRYNVRLG